jgi:hypothetical protein
LWRSRFLRVARTLQTAIQIAAPRQLQVQLPILKPPWRNWLEDHKYGIFDDYLQRIGKIEVRVQNVVSDTDSLPLASSRHVKISVRDYGCGIAADVLTRIFDPYLTTKQGGSGLGLATAHAIVTKHGGHISVQSTVGVGTTFSIYLSACDEIQTPEPSEPTGQQLLRSGSGRILVMDDEEAVRDVLARTLGRLGYECKVITV